MRWPTPLLPARLIRRYKRFLADVTLEDGSIVTVHCPNPGRMTGLDACGARVWLSTSPRTGRKLALTLELVEADGGLVGINTLHPNRLVEEALQARALSGLAAYDRIRREVPYDQGCRIDFLLQGAGLPDCYLEVKNVHLIRGRLAAFPDCVTARGAKHLGALCRQAASGTRAVVLYVVQRMDCHAFCVAADIDPVYAASFEAALDQGVEAMCHGCEIGLDELKLAAAMPIHSKGLVARA